MTPTILSVVITTKNEALNIANAINAFAQFRDVAEVIVVDNASTDDTKAIAASLGAKVLDKGPERSAQRNLGFRTASAPWVLILDADMIMPQETIREILSRISDTSADAPAAYWIPEVRTGSGLRVKARNFERSFYDGTAIDALRLFSKHVLEATGGYDENLIAGPEDWELDIRVKALGVRCEVLKGHLVHNETRLTYKAMLKKKAYYTRSFAAYKAKWPRHPAVRKQFSPFYRMIGVFIEDGKWRKVLAHPILFACVMFERFSVAVVYLANRRHTAALALVATLLAVAGANAAEFIGAGSENGAKPCCVRKEVVNAKSVAKATWRVTGLGVFTPQINGVCAAPDEILMPGYTHFKRRRHEIALDLTPLWNKDAGAVNILSAICTSGWWCDAIAGKNGGTWPAFRAILELEYTDGSSSQIPTDASWQVSSETQVSSAGIWEGETIDARIKPLSWRQAEINREFNGEISPRVGPPIVLRGDLLMAGESFTLKPGLTNVVDFGQNAAAVPVVHITKGGAGVKVSVRLGEMLNDGIKGHHGDGPAGSVYLANMRGASASFDFILDGTDKTFAPLETFYGFRYASITADGEVEGRIVSIPVSSISPKAEHGWVATGVDALNRLVMNAYWGMLSNYLSIPTDCPQRTERYGWTGDTQVFSKTGAYFADVSGFMQKWLQDVRDSQESDGTIPLVCPIGSWDTKGPIAGWSDAAIIVPWTMWKYLGDERIVRDNWNAMVKYFDRIARGYTSKRGDWLLCDWLSYEKLSCDNRTRWSNGGYTEDHLSYQNFLNSCFLLQDCLMMEEMSQVAKSLYLCTDGDPAVKFRIVAAKTRERILATWFKKDGTLIDLFDGMQTPSLFALKLGLGDREKIAASLVAAIHANGDRLATGFLGTPLLCEVLSEIGESQLACTLLLQHEFPSWLYSIDQGATTIWERWDGYTKEKGFGPVSMNSFNHYSYGAVVSWLFEYAAGIRPAGDGSYIIKPQPDKRLGRIKAVWRGVTSEWEYSGETVSFSFTIPSGIKARVALPDGRTAELTGGTFNF